MVQAGYMTRTQGRWSNQSAVLVMAKEVGIYEHLEARKWHETLGT